MARVEVTGINLVMRDIQRIVEHEIRQYAEDVQTTARAKTPIKTGNARRNWNKRETKTGFEVENRVPYIERLDEGYSKQAPRGIVGPTLTEIKRRS
jgi:hypothetical protein